MKRIIKSLTIVALFASYCIPSWGQAPSTEGQDFWVTFLQRNQDAKSSDPRELKLTISAREACRVTISHPSLTDPIVFDVADNSSTEIGTETSVKDINNRNQTLTESMCYSSNSETATQTALHVTATKDISLFAGNYLDKSFDAANILPTPALLDDYLIQTFPPSDHEDKPQGSHFAIVAVEDNTVVDYVLTAQTKGGKTGKQATQTLKKGDVWYVWTGRGSGDAADLSGTTVKARNGKKIAVFQGCVHTNIPDHVRDRDHLFSQAMPTAYWGSEFAITASRKHRRDIIAVMAINDGTEVYINSEDGEPQLVHTFDFSKDKKQYWTFEIGEYLAYCADNEGQSPSHGQLPAPEVVDSSCYLTTSCPAGVHLFMVSNRYDNAVPKVSSDTLVSDPAMLWISPIEQVIKEINFATYKTKQAKFHFMNIVTPTADINDMVWTDQNGDKHNIAEHFHPVRGTDNEYSNQYSFARIEIQHGNHNLKGKTGFLAHVYGYGERESYAYSCGSSTVQRSITFNGLPLEIDSVCDTTFCVHDEIAMKLNIGNNDYQRVFWDFGDGVTYESDPNAPSSEMRQSRHTYTAPGWYDLRVLAEYINPCTKKAFNDTLGLRFYVSRPDTVWHVRDSCVAENYSGELTVLDTIPYGCDSVVVGLFFLHRKSSATIPVSVEDSWTFKDSTYTTSTVIYDTIPNFVGCDSAITYQLNIVKCLGLEMENKPEEQKVCAGENLEIPFSYNRDGGYEKAYLSIVVHDPTAEWGYRLVGRIPIEHFEDKGEEGDRKLATLTLPIKSWTPGHYTGCVLMVDANCTKTEGGIAVPDTIPSPALDITVKYPEELLVFKFNNVLAVLQNKGYDFVTYQWYLNGEKIDPLKNPSAVTSVFHTEEIFTPGDEYFVMLTEKGKDALASCSFFVPKQEDLDDYTTKKEAPAATKKLINNRMCVEFDGRTYDMYGQRIK